jgi:hypothetical protein
MDGSGCGLPTFSAGTENLIQIQRVSAQFQSSIHRTQVYSDTTTLARSEKLDMQELVFSYLDDNDGFITCTLRQV